MYYFRLSPGDENVIGMRAFNAFLNLVKIKRDCEYKIAESKEKLKLEPPKTIFFSNICCLSVGHGIGTYIGLITIFSAWK